MPLLFPLVSNLFNPLRTLPCANHRFGSFSPVITTQFPDCGAFVWSFPALNSIYISETVDLVLAIVHSLTTTTRTAPFVYQKV
jgi:hypothetical protein